MRRIHPYRGTAGAEAQRVGDKRTRKRIQRPEKLEQICRVQGALLTKLQGVLRQVQFRKTRVLRSEGGKDRFPGRRASHPSPQWHLFP